MKSFSFGLLSLAVAGAMAQDPFTIFSQTGRLPDGCIDGYSAGTDTVVFTVPYTYTQVLSIIGSYKNLTWSGNPDDTVTLNGIDNTVGTARNYESAGANVTETITVYDKPVNGPYEEIHTLAPLTIPAANVSFYGDYDGATATPTCNGAATAFNFTIDFCATNATLAAGLLHMIHLTDAQTVGIFLGGRNFSSCAAISSSNTTSSNVTTTMGSPMATFTGGATALLVKAFVAGIGALVVVCLIGL